MTTSLAERCTERLAGLLPEAAARAALAGRPVLVSVAEQVPPIDPLVALAAAARRQKAEAFWSRPRDGTATAAIGRALLLTPSGDGRFVEARLAHGDLLVDTLIDMPRGSPAMARPLLLGGFAFRGEGSHAPQWEGFGSGRLVLPRLQVTTTAEGSWLTVNVFVAEDGTTDAAPEQLAALRRMVLHETPRGDGAVAGARTSTEAGAPRVRDVQQPAAWRALVADAVSAIRSGAFDKVVVARSRHAEAGAALDVFAALGQLRARYPDCYVFGLWSGGRAFVGATPERLVRVDGHDVRASSLAGSAPRGATAAEDAAMAAALLASGKDRAEHAMVRDALVEGLTPYCDDITAPTVPSLFTLPHVHHLHTAVHARLRPGHTVLDLVSALHPTPAVGGSPREAALQFLAEREELDRGWYAAPVGWLSATGGEFAVALRSALIHQHEGWLFAGCGIVADSDPAAEYAETLLKFRPMEQALGAVGTPAVTNRTEGAP